MWLVRGGAFVFGALWGSFFNVAIYRWPRELSVVKPASHCPACKKPVPALRNVPMLSYLLLRGRAACCGAPLSRRYLLVEVLGALGALLVAEHFLLDGPPEAPLAWAVCRSIIYFFFIGGLLIITFVDLEWMEIPDEVSLPAAALGLVSAPMRQVDLYAIVMGAGGAYLAVQVGFVWLYEHITGRRGMGEGDSKLMLMIGAFVGWKGALFSVVAGSLQGLVAAAYLLAVGRKLEPTRPDNSEPGDEQSLQEPRDADLRLRQLKMPFGPFLALAAVEYLFVGDHLIAAYFRLLQSTLPS